MMKILHVTPHFWPFEGGLENLVQQISSHQVRSHEVSVLTISHDKSLPAEEIRNGIRIFRVSGKNIFSLGYFAPEQDFCNILAEINPDVLFTHTRFFLTSFVAGRFFRVNFPHRQWIHVEHGQNSIVSRNPIIYTGAWVIDRSLGRWIFQNANKIVSVSKGGKTFIQQCIQRDVQVIPTGVSVPIRTEPLPCQNRAIFIGRMVREKGVLEILKVAKKSLYWNFEMVGAGPLLRSANLPNIQWRGNIPHEDIAIHVQSADLVILPSWSESLSMSVLESCAQGRAVLATDVGENKNILSEKFIFPARMDGILKNKLDFLQNQFEILSKEGDKNYEYVKNHHPLDAMLSAYDTLLVP